MTNIVHGYVPAVVGREERREEKRGREGETGETETCGEKIYPQVTKPADWLLLSMKEGLYFVTAKSHEHTFKFDIATRLQPCLQLCEAVLQLNAKVTCLCLADLMLTPLV